MAGWDDTMFANLPGSPRRPKPPPNTPMFPVNPLAVVGGLMDQGAEAAGRAASYAAGHGPLDALAPGATAPASAQSSADMFGRDVTAMLQSPTHGGFNPDTAMHATLAAAPLALAANTGRTAEEIATGAVKSGITAYHGSPYDFDRFDISKIGTGEGAQAYGHGLYFAGNEDVAKQYREQLAKGFSDAQGNPLPDETQRALEYIQPKFKASGDYAAGLQDAISRMQDQADFYRRQYGAGPNLYDSAAERLKAVDPNNLKPAGSMYQVNINADPEQFLDWDKPLSEQPPKVQQALGITDDVRNALSQHLQSETPKSAYDPQLWAKMKLLDENPRGSTIAGNTPEGSQALRDAGIPGIKYLDQGSRAAGGDATHNYVTFSDDMIDILRKYGLAGALAPVGAGAATLSILGQPGSGTTINSPSPNQQFY